MSTTQSQPHEMYHCGLPSCNQTFKPGTGAVSDRFCSAQCYYRKIGKHRIDQLAYRDHRYCATSFVKLRDVIPPGRRANSRHISSITDDPSKDPYAIMDDIPECAIGRAYPTQDADFGERIVNTSSRAGENQDKIATGIISPVGTTHHSHVLRPNSVDDALEYAENLSNAVTDLLHEGQHDKHHDREILIHEILRTRLRRGPETMIRQADYERALGKAIVECPR